MEVLDNFNQTMIYTQNEQFIIDIASSPDKKTKKNQFTPKLYGRTSENVVQGVVSFQNFSISGIPNVRYYLFVTGKSLSYQSDYNLYPWERYINSTYYFVIPVVLENCQAGSVMERVKDIISCKLCEKGKYALSMYAGCSDCTEGGVCNNGVIETKPGSFIDFFLLN